MPMTTQELVLTGGDYLNSETIRANFIGDHITYDMEHCQKVKSNGSINDPYYIF